MPGRRGGVEPRCQPVLLRRERLLVTVEAPREERLDERARRRDVRAVLGPGAAVERTSTTHTSSSCCRADVYV